MSAGRLYLAGVGPGDPELLTRKAERVLREVEVIAAPVTAPGEQSQALGIVRELLDLERQRVLPLLFPMRAERSFLEPHWREACRLIAEELRAGRDVAFIALGDPLLYATSLYLLEGMKREYPELPVEVVPGVSSLFAAAAAGMFPLAEGAEKLLVLPATAGAEAVAEALERSDTLVLLKVKPAFEALMKLVAGRDDLALLFAERVGMPGQVVLTDPAAIAAHSPDYLSLLVIRRT